MPEFPEYPLLISSKAMRPRFNGNRIRHRSCRRHNGHGRSHIRSRERAGALRG